MTKKSNTGIAVTEYMLIDGRSVDGAQRIEVRNPATPDELVGTIVRGTVDDVDRAVLSAKRAQFPWAAMSYIQRAEIIGRALQEIEDDIEECATLFVRENGKPLAEAKHELSVTVRRQQQALEYAGTLDIGRHMTAPYGKTFINYRPYGVVVSIIPWNSPIILGFTQVVAALLAGNSVVVKPPETCPLALSRWLNAFAKGVPPGTVNFVTGFPAEIGDGLITHPDVGKIGFTGSIAAARYIMSKASQSVKGLTLELGGNDAAILLSDVDLGDANIRSMVNATFNLSGQVCMAIKRIYVPTKRKDEFVNLFSRAVDELVVGDGLRPSVNIGPLHTKKALQRAQGLLEDSASRGARISTLGQIDDDRIFASGYFMRPAIVTDIQDDAPLMVEEQFCPAIPIATYDDIDEAVVRVNDTVYGLGGSVWGCDVERALDVASRIDSGQVWINAHGPYASNYQAPYGGVKQSGLGRKSGIEGILEYANSQTLTTYEV